MSLTFTITRIHNLSLARQSNRMSHHMESFADGLHSVTSFLTVLKQRLLQFNRRPLDTLGWLLLSHRLMRVPGPSAVPESVPRWMDVDVQLGC